MDFELTDDQQALVAAMTALCADRLGSAELVSRSEGEVRDDSLWSALADMGVFALRLDEAESGVGLGWAEAALVFECLGASLVPGPLVWSHLLAGTVEGFATGERRGSAIWRNDPLALVEHPHWIDEVVVLDHHGVWSVPVGDLSLVELHRPTDPLTPVARIESELAGGTQIADADAVGQLVMGATLLRSALALGIASTVTQRAVAFSLEREQFGRPVGSFQALKHLMADMAVRAEMARAAVYAAGVTMDDPQVGLVPRAVAVARLAAVEAGLRNAEANIQVHGGMGYTWEVDAHLFLKRAMVIDATIGSADEAAELVAGCLT